MEKIDFNQWFDIQDTDYLRAYEHLNKTGCWPEGFIPEHVTFSPAWNASLAFKMANAYVDIKLHP